MYYIKKTFTISACHHLVLDYESKCSQVHGHNWRITVYCKARELDRNGMVVDFTQIKALVSDRLDHADINQVLKCNPTAENMARWIVDQIPSCYKASVQETDDNEATYVVDGED